MTRTAVLALAILGAAVSLPASDRERFNAFRDRRCGIGFLYPSSWVVIPRAVPGDCRFELHSARRGNTVSVLFLAAGTGGLPEAASAAGFYLPKEGKRLNETEAQHPGEWMFDSGVLPVVAEPVEDGSCAGLQAAAGSRCYDDQGAYSGLCETFSGCRVGNGRWLAASGNDEHVLSLVLGSLLLEPVPPN